MQTRSFVGLDVHKETISVSVAEDGRNGAARYLGVIQNIPDEIHKLAKRLSRHGELDFCYEAGGCGYGIYRQLTALGHRCIVVAPSMIAYNAWRTDQNGPSRFAEARYPAPLRRPYCSLGSRRVSRSGT